MDINIDNIVLMKESGGNTYIGELITMNGTTISMTNALVFDKSDTLIHNEILTNVYSSHAIHYWGISNKIKALIENEMYKRSIDYVLPSDRMFVRYIQKVIGLK